MKYVFYSLTAFVLSAISFVAYLWTLRFLSSLRAFNIRTVELIGVVTIILFAFALWLLFRKKVSSALSGFCFNALFFLLFFSTYYWYDTRPNNQGEHYDYVFTGNYHKVFDPELGYHYEENSVYNQFNIRVHDHLHDTLFHATYTADSLGRRIMPESAQKKKAVVFMGCSYTYGVGVNDTETLPYYYYLLDTNANVYNYGIDGYGPNNALRLLQTKNLKSELTGDSVTAFYIYIGDHIPRVAGSKSHFNMWTKNFPYYIENADTVKYAGRFEDAKPVRAFLYKALAEFTLIDKLFVYRNWVSKADHDLTARVIGQLQKEFYRQFPNGHFTLVIHPSEQSRFDIRPYFDRHKVHYIDGLSLTDTMNTLMIPYEPHPNKYGHQVMARFIYDNTKR